MDTTLSYKIDVYRRLSIKKDLIELSQWIDIMVDMNTEIDHFKLINHQLIKNSSVAASLQGFRRKNTLIMGLLCKYEQELKKEHQYGKREYDFSRAKEHEKYRDQYGEIIEEFRQLKKVIYINLSKYKR